MSVPWFASPSWRVILDVNIDLDAYAWWAWMRAGRLTW